MSDRTKTLSVHGLERKEITATGAFLDAFLSLDGPNLAEARPDVESFRDKLRSTLESPDPQPSRERLRTEFFAELDLRVRERQMNLNAGGTPTLCSADVHAALDHLLEELEATNA